MITISRFSLLVGRAVRLRCPICGRGRLFAGWFRMHDRCPECAADFQREPGFYLGSIYFNYGLTALVVAIVYPLLLFQAGWSQELLLGLALGFTVLFPLLFFRHARSLWLGFDQLYDPKQREE